MIARDFICDVDEGHAFEELVDRDAHHTRCPTCGARASIRLSFGAIGGAKTTTTTTTTRAVPAPKPKKTEDQKRELHQKATANLAREIQQHSGGTVSEAKAKEKAQEIGQKVLVRAAAGE